MTSSPQAVTDWLIAWSDGHEAALDQLIPLVHEELRRLAKGYMRRERGQRAAHTLQTTALVNEAYLRLIDARRVQWQNRAHFFAIAARLMRRLERGRNGGGVEGLARHRDARLAIGESLALARTERRGERCGLNRRRNCGGGSSGSGTRLWNARSPSAPRFSPKLARAMRSCAARSNRCSASTSAPNISSNRRPSKWRPRRRPKR